MKGDDKIAYERWRCFCLFHRDEQIDFILGIFYDVLFLFPHRILRHAFFSVTPCLLDSPLSPAKCHFLLFILEPREQLRD